MPEGKEKGGRSLLLKFASDIGLEGLRPAEIGDQNERLLNFIEIRNERQEMKIVDSKQAENMLSLKFESDV